MFKKMKSLVRAFVSGVEDERLSILVRELERKKQRVIVDHWLTKDELDARLKDVEIPEWLNK